MRPFFLVLLSVTGLSSIAVAQESSFYVTSPAPPAADICNSSATVTCTTYSFTFTTNTSSSDNITWSLGSGSFPQGLNLGSKSGILSGNITNTAQANTGFFLSASDSSTESYTSTPFYTFTVNSQPAITTTALPVGTIGHAYPATTLTATGGTLPYTWSVVNNTLPAGFALSSSGVLSAPNGPAASGTFYVMVMMTDSAGSSGNGATSLTATIPLTVLPALAVTSSPTLVPAEVNVPYSFTFAASGGTPPYTWSLNSGSRLPTGLALSSSGVLSGTPTTASSGFSFSLTVSDSGSGNAAQAVSQTATLVINPLPTVLTSSLPSGMVGASYSAAISGQGGSTPYTWSVASGSLPPGLTLNTATGGITGTPVGPAGTATFAIRITDASSQGATQSLSILINPATLAITTTTLPSGTVLASYSAKLSAQGGTAPYNNWAISVGSLPAGLALNPSTGAITGTPTTAGASSFTVKLTDSGNPAQTATQSLNILINPAALNIVTSALPSGNVGSAYSVSLAAQGGTPPYNNWALSSGSLPTGLAINTYSGAISGTPTAAGMSSFTVKLTDSGNPAQSATQSFSISIYPATLIITTASLPSGIVGSAYSASLAAQGGTIPYSSWALSYGSLPSGLALNALTGAITGTPTTAGTSNFTIKLTDSGNPAQTATQSLSILVAPPGFTITSTSLSAGMVGTAYSASVVAQGGTPPYTGWSISSGSLPQGLALNASSGAITGTPTAAGTSQFTVKVADSSVPAQTATQSLSIAIAPSTLTVSATTLANGSVGSPYSAQLNAQGGTTPYASWTVSSGSLPGGLSLNPVNGIVSGTPTTTGTFTFTVKVIDSGSPAQTASQTFTITIFAGVTITTTVLPNGTQGLTYSATLTAQSGTGPYTWSITTGTLPAGLVLNSQTGVISGMPTANGTFTFTVKVTDSTTPTAESATQLLSLLINPPVTTPILPTFTLSGIPATATPGTNITNGTVALSQPSSAAYSGTLTVTFSPSEANLPAGYLGDAGFVDSSGNKSSTATLLVPALSSSVPLPTFDPGTVAGTFTVTLTVAGQVVASTTITIAASAPVIEANSVQITNVTSGGFDVELVATSTTRQLSLATFTFLAATGSQISGTATFTVDVSSLLAGWYASSSGLTYGGAFSLTIPFTLTGPASAIQSVSVTLANSVGTSAAVSGTQ